MKTMVREEDVMHHTVRGAYFTYHTGRAHIDLRTCVEVTGRKGGRFETYSLPKKTSKIAIMQT